MEDGAFLARCIGKVIDGKISLAQAVGIYETGRMPKASYKQQVSYLNGWMWHLDGPAADARDKTMQCELDGQMPIRSANLYGDPATVVECYGYDAEAHADEEICRFLKQDQPDRDAKTTVTAAEAEKIVNWFLPSEHKFKLSSRL